MPSTSRTDAGSIGFSNELQVLKAQPSITSNLLLKMTLFKLVQLKNANSLRVLKLLGNMTSSKSVHLLKQDSGTTVIPSGILIEESNPQSAKALSPRRFTDDGNAIDCNLTQYSKAYGAISVVPSTTEYDTKPEFAGHLISMPDLSYSTPLSSE